MNRKDILDKYEEEDRILISKVMEKVERVKTRNVVEVTDFLDLRQKELVKELLKKLQWENAIFYGGIEEAERVALFIIPDKLKEMGESITKKEGLLGIRIDLPKELMGEYGHKNYLGAIMKLGVKREKVGDILVREEGADVILKEEIAEYLLTSLQELTRFRKAEIRQISVAEIKKVEIEKEEIEIIIPSLRLDCVVTELLHLSRSAAKKILEEERVFVNFKLETKSAKEIKIGDKITIRGKGRFELKSLERKTKGDNLVVKVEK